MNYYCEVVLLLPSLPVKEGVPEYPVVEHGNRECGRVLLNVRKLSLKTQVRIQCPNLKHTKRKLVFKHPEMLRITQNICFCNSSDNLAYNQGSYNTLQAWNKNLTRSWQLGTQCFYCTVFVSNYAPVKKKRKTMLCTIKELWSSNTQLDWLYKPATQTLLPFPTPSYKHTIPHSYRPKFNLAQNLWTAISS